MEKISGWLTWQPQSDGFEQAIPSIARWTRKALAAQREHLSKDPRYAPVFDKLYKPKVEE